MKLRVHYFLFILLFLTACNNQPFDNDSVTSEFDIQVEAIEKVSHEIDQFTHEIIQDRAALDDAINDLELYK